MANKPKNNIVTPLYKKKQWGKWQLLFEKTTAPMTWSFEQWLQNHNETVKKLKVSGDPVYEIEVDIDDYCSWTLLNHLPVDGHTRTDFALALFDGRATGGNKRN